MMVRQQQVRKTNQHMFLQVNIGAKTQCLSKEIGVGVVIPCWRMSQYTEVLRAAKLKIFIYAQNIDSGFTLEPP